MSKLKNAMKIWRRLPRKTRRNIKHKARSIVGREKRSKKGE